ncbi:subunit of TIM23 translocase complex [Dispira simplex]|nr:subunit of TIM23 translocase complex [Dispira simplex]
MAEPSVWDKMKMGALMGTTVGLGLGFVYGTITILRTMGQYMLSSAATFGFFMSIGSVIRTEGPVPNNTRFIQNGQRIPIRTLQQPRDRRI